MARIIPNSNTWIGFVPISAGIANIAAPTTAELGNAIDLTPFVISLTANATGNVVPTPTIDSLFETSVSGTVSASFTADFYRDDASGQDTAWTTLTRATKGYVVISRFSVDGANPSSTPTSGQSVEVWPVVITSRSAGPLTSNTAQTFTVNAAIWKEPSETATVSSGTAVPSAPLNLVGAKGGDAVASTTPASFAITGNTLVLDWDAPAAPGGTITGYSLGYATNAALTTGITAVTTNVTFAGTSVTVATAGLTAAGTGTKYWFVTATNATGTGPRSNAVTVTLT